MTTETRQVIQYVAIALFSVFTCAILAVFVYGYVRGQAPDGTILAYVGAIMGVITAILGVNSGANTSQQATQAANQNTAAVAAAVNGSGGNAALAHVGLNPANGTPSSAPAGPVDGSSDAGGA